MKLRVKEITVFGMLGAVMLASKFVLDAFPNIHLLGMFTISFTLVYRKKALYPIYTYVLILGMFSGFAAWWIPHLYLWAVLWGMTMLLPRNLSPKIAPTVYMLLCAAHGFLYGTLYAPTQALLFGLDLQGTIAWIISGLPFDLIHGVSNFFCASLVVPVTKALRLAERAIP